MTYDDAEPDYEANVRDKTSQNWFVYMILCSDNSLYTGITNDVARRFKQHEGRNGAKYFRSRTPLQLVYLESGHTQRSAGQREWQIKQMGRAGKRLLLDAPTNDLAQTVQKESR